MLKWLILLLSMNIVFPTISLPSDKENDNINACVKHGVVSTTCTTPDGDPGTCVHSQDCLIKTNVDSTGIGNKGKRGHYPAKLTPSRGPLVCCIASKSGKAAVTSSLNDTERPKINRVKRSSASDCGLRNPNNLSGIQTPKNEAMYGELPWMVSVLQVIETKDQGGTFTFKYIGGGALIRRRIVLTGADVVHKVSSSSIYVAVGDHDQLTIDEKNKKIMTVLDVIIHEDFNLSTFAYDIAMLLINDIPNMPNIKPICLPSPSVEPPTDTVCYQSGWTKHKTDVRYNILSKIEMSIVDRRTCQNRLYSSDLGPAFILNETFICAQGQPNVDTCKGSGGSPLICSIKGQEGRFAIWGIAAATLHCGADGYPDLFTHVSYLEPWIKDNLFNLGVF